MEPAFIIAKEPRALPIYKALEEALLAAHPDVGVKEHKTQVTFSNRYGFAFASLPHRKMKGWPEVCLVLSLGLGYRLESPRVAVAANPYPRRWTNHILLAAPEDVDEELMGFVQEAWEFALVK